MVRDDDMGQEHEAHLSSIVAEMVSEVKTKYRKGQAEHGGKLWEKEDLLDESIGEATDLMVYLLTERRRRNKANPTHNCRIAEEMMRIEGKKDMLTFESPQKALAVLMEEVGEVARAALRSDRTNMIEELVQVAAFTTLWLEVLEG